MASLQRPLLGLLEGIEQLLDLGGHAVVPRGRPRLAVLVGGAARYVGHPLAGVVLRAPGRPQVLLRLLLLRPANMYVMNIQCLSDIVG